MSSVEGLPQQQSREEELSSSLSYVASMRAFSSRCCLALFRAADTEEEELCCKALLTAHGLHDASPKRPVIVQGAADTQRAGSRRSRLEPCFVLFRKLCVPLIVRRDECLRCSKTMSTLPV